MIHVRQTDAAGNTSTVSKNPTGTTVDTGAPSVTNTAITSSGPYKEGDVIDVTVTYDENVDVTGKPYLRLVVDSTNRRAEYQSGTGSTELVFRYTVGASETDTDGVVVTANSLNLNKGTIQDGASNDASLGNTAVSADNAHLVDTTAPRVTSTAITSTGPYKAGAVIEVTVTYDEAVEVDTRVGTPSLTLVVGTTNRQAEYQSGTGSTELVFRYTVVANETDANGVVVTASSLALNSGTIQDLAGNAASRTNAAVEAADDQKVDTTAPRVTRTAITSTGPYKAGAVIEVTVTYGETVEVDTKSGRPSLTLEVGANERQARYARGTRSTELVFEYTVVANETDANGVVVKANSLALNSGKISDVAGNAAFLRHLAVSADTDHLVDTTAPRVLTVTWPTDTGSSSSDGITNANTVTISTPESGASWEYSVNSGTNWTPGSGNSFTLLDGTYTKDMIHVRQRDAADNPSAVSKNPTGITVDTRAPDALTMTLPRDTGKSSSDGLTKENRFTVSGVEDDASWEYSSDSGENWTDGGSVSSFTLSDRSYAKDTIQVRQTDAAGNTSAVRGNTPVITVDTTAPRVTKTEITSEGPYKAGAVIDVTVTYDENVDVTGRPYLRLVVGSTNRRAEYQSGTGSTELVFRYTVVASETDTDGVVVTANSLNLNKGTIQDGAGNDASLGNTAVSADNAHLVDTTGPSVTRTAITSTGPYKEGDAIEVTVTYDEAVEVDTRVGTPSLTLVVGTTNHRQAEYQSVDTGSTELVFRYTGKVANETDANGVVVTAKEPWEY